MNNGDLQQNMDKMKNMDENQMKGMLDMMKNNKEMMKEMYRSQGMEMSDQQMDMMSSMLTPETMKKSMEMAASNPEMVQQSMNKMRAKNPANFPETQ